MPRKVYVEREVWMESVTAHYKTALEEYSKYKHGKEDINKTLSIVYKYLMEDFILNVDPDKKYLTELVNKTNKEILFAIDIVYRDAISSLNDNDSDDDDGELQTCENCVQEVFRRLVDVLAVLRMDDSKNLFIILKLMC